jgi:hypothetical protein
LVHEGEVLCAVFSPDSELLVTCAMDQTVRFWQTQTGQPAGEKLVHDQIIKLATFSPDGQILATASPDGTIRLWDTRRRTLVGVLETQTACREMAFHPNGSLLLVTTWKMTRIWDPVSQQSVSPAIKRSPSWLDLFVNQGLGLHWGEDGRIVGFFVESTGTLVPDRRSAEDLVKLSQLYSGRRLDDKGGLIPLRREELQVLWRELHAKYPEEYASSPDGIVKWRIGQLLYLDTKERPAEIAFHRRWLAAELADLRWQPGEQGNENLMQNDYFQRLCALALHGRHTEATAAADALAPRWSNKPAAAPYTLNDCARVHALAARAVKGDGPLAERYAVRAVTLLRQAAAAGFKDSQSALKDPDLEGLRPRKDFMDFLKELPLALVREDPLGKSRQGRG